MKYRKLLKNLNVLQQKIFYIYLKQDYAEKHFIYERDFHFINESIFQQMKTLRRSTSLKLIESVNHMVEILMALGQLRYRIADPTTFAVCEKEFVLLSKTIDTIFLKLAKGNAQVETELEKLTSAIQAFEAVYRATLQVVSKEPMIFLIFIYDLYAMRDELAELKQVMSNEQ